MKFHVVAAGVVLAMVGLVQRTEAGVTCVVDKEKGPSVCNCTGETADVMLCTSTEVKVHTDLPLAGPVLGPGFSVTAGAGYSATVPTAGLVCAREAMPPFTCMWWVYQSEICIDWVLVQETDFSYLEPRVTVKFLGAALVSGPAGPDDC